MKTVSISDVGRLRTVNEDRAFVKTNQHDVTVAIVADGMGGHQAGDIASQKATQLIQKQLLSLEAHCAPEVYLAEVNDAILQANQMIHELSLKDPKYRGMGTTVVTAVIVDQQLFIGHIGDSRAYLFREGQLTQVTDDHSLVNELVKSGQITSEEAIHHPRRNVLIRALGTDAEVQVDVQALSWMPQDILLLCSDGLSGMIGYDGILHILQQYADIEETADKLVESALEAGGDDNVTVVLLANDSSQEGEVNGS